MGGGKYEGDEERGWGKKLGRSVRNSGEEDYRWRRWVSGEKGGGQWTRKMEMCLENGEGVGKEVGEEDWNGEGVRRM